jgi:hypothetical protein
MNAASDQSTTEILHKSMRQSEDAKARLTMGNLTKLCADGVLQVDEPKTWEETNPASNALSEAFVHAARGSFQGPFGLQNFPSPEQNAAD